MKSNFTPQLAVIGIISLAALGFLFLMALGLLSNSSVTGQSGFRLVNKPAPAFALPTLDSSELALASYIGEPIVVNFWASWCPPCREEAALLE